MSCSGLTASFPVSPRMRSGGPMYATRPRAGGGVDGGASSERLGIVAHVDLEVCFGPLGRRCGEIPEVGLAVKEKLRRFTRRYTSREFSVPSSGTHCAKFGLGRKGGAMSSS